jgi:hypothetical protein
MTDLPPLAFEYGGMNEAGVNIFMPVEAPPCGERLLVPDHDIDLFCDLPESHERRGPFKHRAILDRSAGHFVTWCDGECSNPCHHVSTVVLPFLQRVRRSQP